MESPGGTDGRAVGEGEAILSGKKSLIRSPERWSSSSPPIRREVKRRRRRRRRASIADPRKKGEEEHRDLVRKRNGRFPTGRLRRQTIATTDVRWETEGFFFNGTAWRLRGQWGRWERRLQSPRSQRTIARSLRPPLPPPARPSVPPELSMPSLFVDPPFGSLHSRGGDES